MRKNTAKTLKTARNEPLKLRMVAAMARTDGAPWTQMEIVEAVRRAMGAEAEDVKLSQANISKVCRGEVARSDWVPHIAHVLGVDAFWLATGVGKREPNGADPIEPRHRALLRNYLDLPKELRLPIRQLIEINHSLLHPEKTAEIDQRLIETDKQIRAKHERDGRTAKRRTSPA